MNHLTLIALIAASLQVLIILVTKFKQHATLNEDTHWMSDHLQFVCNWLWPDNHPKSSKSMCVVHRVWQFCFTYFHTERTWHRFLWTCPVLWFPWGILSWSSCRFSWFLPQWTWWPDTVLLCSEVGTGGSLCCLRSARNLVESCNS